MMKIISVTLMLLIASGCATNTIKNTPQFMIDGIFYQVIVGPNKTVIWEAELDSKSSCETILISEWNNGDIEFREKIFDGEVILQCAKESSPEDVPYLAELVNIAYGKVTKLRLASFGSCNYFSKLQQDNDSTKLVCKPDLAINPPKLTQKIEWVSLLAIKNGCVGDIKVEPLPIDGIRESFEALCPNKKIIFTCEFDGIISTALGGIPFVAVSGKSYTTKPACWR
jgi:hypothetical protein